MSKTTRFKRLLDRGFYPAELPPPFRTRNYSSIVSALAPKNGYSGSTTFFDMATFRGALRTLGVINPVNYFLLSKHISSSWSDITKVFKISSCSGAKPKFPDLKAEGRAIQSASISNKRQSQQHLASGFPVILNLDINRFYGSIYTHSIPWAALGKEPAKLLHGNNKLKGHWSDTLDRFVRNCNQRQTVGIAIGPDTSRIVSELILSRIDAELCAKGTGVFSHQVFHNIDDYQIGAMNPYQAELAQSQFVRSISKFELRLNDHKTSISHGITFAPASFELHFESIRGKKGKAFVDHFFELVYEYSAKFPDSNVIGYSLKVFSKLLASSNNADLVREYLQRLLFAAPHQARWIFPLLLGLTDKKNPPPDTKRLISWGIETTARRNDAGNLLWFLYAAIFVGAKINSSLCKQCVGISSELVDLMLVHGRFLGLFSTPVTDIRKRYSNLALTSPAWIVLYEVQRHGWDTSSAFLKIGSKGDPGGLYQALLGNNVEFYQPSSKFFSVEAFDGWALSESDFVPSNKGDQEDITSYFSTYYDAHNFEYV